jgi:hypothetical protein
MSFKRGDADNLDEIELAKIYWTHQRVDDCLQKRKVWAQIWVDQARSMQDRDDDDA